jgi:DNA (cytosine-5)-methyltransferase 1
VKPRLLDLFCGAGGCSVGYHRAGFDVVGVDINPQPRYPFRFIQGDALRAVERIVSWGNGDGFAAIHASPPCQAHSDLQKQSKLAYEDFIPRTRHLLRMTGLPYVIENVEGAPLVDPVVLCGVAFPDLRVIRHRLFECSFPVLRMAHQPHPLVFTHDKRKSHYGALDQNESYVQVTGGGNCTVANKRDAMGIDWMIGRELNEAIPPAYTEFIGRQLMDTLVMDAAA